MWGCHNPARAQSASQNGSSRLARPSYSCGALQGPEATFVGNVATAAHTLLIMQPPALICALTSVLPLLAVYK